MVVLLVLLVTPSSARAEPKVVRVGGYISRLHAISLKDNSFTVEFYLWFRWNPEEFAKPGAVDKPSEGALAATGDDERAAIRPPHETFELVGGADVVKQVDTERPGYAAMRIKAQLTQFWDVSQFPFDDHVLRIVLEDTNSEAHLMRYEPDIEGSSIAPEFQVPGWSVKPLVVRTATHVYHTSFGEPTLPTASRSEYAQTVFEVPIVRTGFGTFLKFFAGLFVSVAIAIVAFFIRPSEVDPRFGLPVGALFAAVASEFIVASSLPDSVSVALADRLHHASFIAIFAVVAESAIVLHLAGQAEEDEATWKRIRRIDLRAFSLVSFAWVTAVVWLVGRAVVR